MIECNKDQIIKQIQKAGFRHCRVYEGYKNPGEETPQFMYMTCETPDELIAEFEDFSGDYPGKFTLALYRHQSSADSTRCKVRYNGLPKVKKEDSKPMNGSPQVDRETIKAELMEEIRREKEIQDLKDKLEEKQQALNGIQTQGDKLAYVGMKILDAYMKRKTGASPMQGTETQEQKPIENPEALKVALNKLVAVLGEDTIINLASKITPGDPVINIVKDYANK